MIPRHSAYRDEDLARDSHRVAITGRLGSLAWPDLCPNCGTSARERVTVRKLFRRQRRREPWHYVVARLRIPLCSDCTARHRLLEQNGGDGRPQSRVPGEVVIGLLVIGGVAFELFRRILPGTGLIGVLLLALVVLGLMASLSVAWWYARRLHTPPLTEVARSCDFSDNLGLWFVGSRRVFAIRNGEFARALERLNRHRLWTDAVRRRDQVMNTAIIAVILGLLALWLFAA